MKEYIINEAKINGKMKQVLFSDFHFEGEGNFCGWYAVEYGVNSKIIAYADGREVVAKEEVFEKVEIRSVYTGTPFDAENDEAAIKYFKEFINPQIPEPLVTNDDAAILNK